MTVTIAVVSGKGGTGKTTTALSLACALAEHSYRVLAVDMDPQANLTSGSGYNPYELQDTVLQVLTGESVDGSAILHTQYGIDLLPCSPQLSSIESALPSLIGQQLLLSQTLEHLTNYDFVLIDTPPSFGFHTTNALAAADYLLVPVQMSGFALNGLNEVQRTMASVRQELNPRLRILGVLPTFVAPRTNFSHDMLAALRALPDLRVFQTQLNSTVKFAESSLEGVPMLTYASASKAARAYRQLALEVIDRTEMPVPGEEPAAAVPTWVRPLIPEAGPAALQPTTGALSVDAVALLGVNLPETGVQSNGNHSSAAVLLRTQAPATTNPAIRLMGRIRVLARRLVSDRAA